MTSVTCPICETQIEKIPDGIARFCKCKALAVDHTKEYTRFIGGIVPKEDPHYFVWYTRFKDIIEAKKIAYSAHTEQQ